jgi:hypothetical protein
VLGIRPMASATAAADLRIFRRFMKYLPRFSCRVLVSLV